jgi:hypothetical protein
VLAIDHVKSLIDRSDWEMMRQIEDQMIDPTCGMVRAGVLDTDHGVLNLVVTPSGRPIKLDLEIARRVIFSGLAAGRLGGMIGRLVATYGFALRPDMEKARVFAMRLAEKPGASARSLRVAKSYIERMMDKQLREKGIDGRICLPW